MDIFEIAYQETTNRKRVGRRAYLSIFLSIIACVLLMVSQVLLSLLFAPAFSLEFINRSTAIVFESLIYVLSFVVSFGFTRLLFKYFLKNPSPYNAKRYIPQRPMLYIIGTIGICYICNLTVQLLFRNFINDYSIETTVPYDTPLSIVLYYVYIALLPAIFEELAFRHVILTNLLPYGKWGAIICSSLLFGIVHIDPPRVIFATIFGLLLAICREYTGSLIVPMIIHFINNAISVTLSIVPPDSPIGVMFLLSIYLFMIVGIVAIIYYLRKGLNRKKLTLIKPNAVGYKLTFSKYLIRFIFNIGLIPLGVVYLFFFYLYFLA